MSAPFTLCELQASHLFDVKGWVAIVTGGGTGLGIITAASLLANGAARVYITGRRESVLHEAAKTYGASANGEIIPIVCDVTKKEEIQELLALVTAKETFVNLLVNNAGIGGFQFPNFHDLKDPETISKTMWSSEMKTWNETLHINTSAVYFASAAFLPLLVAAKDRFGSPGSILNVSSMAGITTMSMGGQFAYNTAKAGTISLTKQLAYEFRKPELGVRVNTIAPGYFPSGMLPGDRFPEDPDDVRSKWAIPLGRPGNAKDYAQAVLNIVVDNYMNGSTVVIDGGWLLEQSQANWPVPTEDSATNAS